MMAMTQKQASELMHRFRYHPPVGQDQIDRYQTMRAAGSHLALSICQNTPLCREQQIAIQHVEEAVMWANAAIARRSGKPGPDPDGEQMLSPLAEATLTSESTQ